ncbi:MAG: polysaccharide biosynthesis C-terminal domain-containing protein, partial [Armatimonadetes bacterium]|nr:polysaccharide biosynthesis C-terminal domain-containing protein [Armatimonadota bacterium]
QFFETGVHLMKRTVYRAIALVSAAAANVLLNLVLIPRYGMMGAAFATLLSFAILAALAYVFGQRLYRIPYEFGRAAKIALAASALYWVGTLITIDSVATSAAVRLGLVASYPVLLWFLGFYRDEELRQAREGYEALKTAVRTRLPAGRSRSES